MRVSVIVLVVAAALAVAAQDAVVLTYFSDSSCTSYEGSRTFANGISSDLRGAKGGNCAEELECYYNPDSDLCASISTDVGDFVNNVTFNVTTVDLNHARVEYESLSRTDIYSYDQCIESEVFFNCYFQFRTAEKFSRNLADECARVPVEDARQSAHHDGVAHIMFFTSNNCQAGTLAAISPLQRGVEYTVRRGNGDVATSCVEQLACFFNPDSEACDALGDNGLHEFYGYATSLSTVTSNFDQGDRLYYTDTCLKSEQYENCYYSIVTNEVVDSRIRTCSGENLAWLQYFSGDECEGDNLVVTRPFSRRTEPFTGGSAATCEESTRCFWDPERCSGSPAVYTFVTVADPVTTTWEDVPAVGEGRRVWPPTCYGSGFYENCDFIWESHTTFQEVFACGSRGTDIALSEITEEENSIAYLSYYNSADCGYDSFEMARPVGESDVTLVGADGPSCRESLWCFIHPDSLDCQDVSTGSTTTIHLETVKGHVFEVFEDQRTYYDSNYCTRSSVYSGCYFRYYTNREMRTMAYHRGDDCSFASKLAAPLLVTVLAAIVASLF
eukprot:CAMPEP_0119127912 /NCGR_PEP_ID=MMETSP1310-20130426/6271_1 /TAXON_ID=464262 /ORGANISM="Genus nov. species nov., Strain RCC2339" /LENGTH=556 /DNA_ID=CAMNT_0007118199 /DNA_START=39 /DNA_END=1709 /DNA_ORIENTATION=-